MTIPAAASDPNTQLRLAPTGQQRRGIGYVALEDLRVQGAAPRLQLRHHLFSSSPGSSTSITLFWIFDADRASSYVI